MTIKTFTQRVEDGLILSIADALDAEIDRSNAENITITPELVHELLDTANTKLKHLHTYISFEPDMSIRLGSSLKRVMYAAPELREATLPVILQVFHMLNHRSKLSKTENKTQVLTLGTMIELGFSDKIKSKQDSYLMCLFKYVYDMSNVNNFVFTKDCLDGLSHSLQERWFEKINFLLSEDTDKHKVALTWFSTNFIQLATHAIDNDLKSFAFELMLLSLDFESESVHRDSKPSTKRIRIDKTRESYTSYTQSANALREFVYGDIATFKRNLEVAEGLGLVDDRSFWLGTQPMLNCECPHDLSLEQI